MNFRAYFPLEGLPVTMKKIGITTEQQISATLGNDPWYNKCRPSRHQCKVQLSESITDNDLHAKKGHA